MRAQSAARQLKAGSGIATLYTFDSVSLEPGSGGARMDRPFTSVWGGASVTTDGVVCSMSSDVTQDFPQHTVRTR
jgi:hypothetical protein